MGQTNQHLPLTLRKRRLLPSIGFQRLWLAWSDRNIRTVMIVDARSDWRTQHKNLLIHQCKFKRSDQNVSRREIVDVAVRRERDCALQIDWRARLRDEYDFAIAE